MDDRESTNQVGLYNSYSTVAEGIMSINNHCPQAVLGIVLQLIYSIYLFWLYYYVYLYVFRLAVTACLSLAVVLMHLL